MTIYRYPLRQLKEKKAQAWCMDDQIIIGVLAKQSNVLVLYVQTKTGCGFIPSYTQTVLRDTFLIVTACGYIFGYLLSERSVPR